MLKFDKTEFYREKVFFLYLNLLKLDKNYESKRNLDFFTEKINK